jgi:hypothetical protein
MDCTTTAQAGDARQRLWEVALDTSALSNLCASEPDPAGALVGAGRALDARLILLPETLVESFIGEVTFSRRRADMRSPAGLVLAPQLDEL